MLTATAGFRHGSIEAARRVLTTLGTTTGEFTVTATENVSESRPRDSRTSTS